MKEDKIIEVHSGIACDYFNKSNDHFMASTHHSGFETEFKNILKSLNRKIVIATQSYEILEKIVLFLPEEYKKHFVYYRFEESKIKAYSYEELKIAIEAKLEVR